MDKKELYENLPEAPGVYIMKGASGAVVYVGKAVNLRRRVSSYFTRPHDSRIEALVQEIVQIEHRQTESGIEALILEARLIKEWAPKYNIREKDGKSFLYVEFGRGAYPTVRMVRGKDTSAGYRFGPFVSASSLRAALGVIRKIFPWSDHAPKEKGGKPCFNYQIGLCPGTCIGAVTKEEYGDNIKNLKLFFKGERKKVLKNLEVAMKGAARATDFERAERMKRQIFALQHIQDVATVKEDEIASDSASQGVRVEGYDISNISGTSAVGAMVVFIDGAPDKGEYRLFNIRAEGTPDDVGMMREVLFRRLENKWPLPACILVDGGEGHRNMAQALLAGRGLTIPVVGLAKGPDRKNNRFVGDIPPGVSEKTLIRARDEAHRFSRAAHIRRRGKAFLGE